MTDKKLPDPLIEMYVDLQNFRYMPVDIVAIRFSDFCNMASDKVFRAAFNLWCAAWHQVPAGSLPDDDKYLAKMAGVSLKWFRANATQTLHGFIKCSDMRLYHPTIVEQAQAAWGRKKRGLKSVKPRITNKHAAAYLSGNSEIIAGKGHGRLEDNSDLSRGDLEARKDRIRKKPSKGIAIKPREEDFENPDRENPTSGPDGGLLPTGAAAGPQSHNGDVKKIITGFVGFVEKIWGQPWSGLRIDPAPAHQIMQAYDGPIGALCAISAELRAKHKAGEEPPNDLSFMIQQNAAE